MQNAAHYPLHHMTYSGTKFEVATSNDIGGDSFTKTHYFTVNLDLGVNVT